MSKISLIIDTGNTFHKIAVIKERTILEERVVPTLSEGIIDELCDSFAPARAIVSSTRSDAAKSVKLLKDRIEEVICLDSKTPLPIEVEYDRERLGTDRIAAAVGAVAKYGTEQSMLIIDAGTAITFDFVECGVFKGGNISPGVDMRLEALAEKTATLPLCEPMVLEGEGLQIGHTTEEAVKNGVMEGVFYEVKGYIDSFCEKNENILIIFIGGDAEYFVNRIKNAIFAGRNIMYDGLNRILEYNAEV